MQNAPPVPSLTRTEPKPPPAGFLEHMAIQAAKDSQDFRAENHGAVMEISAQKTTAPFTITNTSTSFGSALTSAYNPPSSSSTMPLAQSSRYTATPPAIQATSDEHTREMTEQLSRKRVADMIQARKPVKKQRKRPSCRRCGSPECPGKRGNLDKCYNPCQDCGRIGQCNGRNLQSNPKRPCQEAWR